MIEDRERLVLAGLMARMAGGDATALFVFLDRFAGKLAGVVKRHLRAFGRGDVVIDREQIDFLVVSAAMAIFDRAGGWSADGALPWTWADRAIRAAVVAHIGHPTIEIDTANLADHGQFHADGAGRKAGQSNDPDSFRLVARLSMVDDFAALAEREPVVALLRDAIAQVGSRRDQQVHIQYRIQKRLGDSSPAHTVAAEFGLAPDNVRQIDHRVRARLRALIDSDERFGSLGDLEWLAAC